MPCCYSTNLKTMRRVVTVGSLLFGASIGSVGYSSCTAQHGNKHKAKYSDLALEMGYDENDDWPQPKFVTKYNLDGILRKWTKLDDEDRESWPWIWCQRNINQKCIVFIGVSDDLQQKISAVRGLNVNIVLIVDDKKRLFDRVDEEFCYESQCGILEGSVQQIDTINNILMTADERIIAFDECIIVKDYTP